MVDLMIIEISDIFEKHYSIAIIATWYAKYIHSDPLNTMHGGTVGVQARRGGGRERVCAFVGENAW